MADFLQMLRQKNIFPRGEDEPLGMPKFDRSDPFHEAFALSEEAKGQDLRRRKELMQFQANLQRRGEMNPVVARQLAQPKKNYVLGPGSGTGALKPSTVEADNAARDAKAADMNREFAAVNAQREELAARRQSSEKIAADKLAAASVENKTAREFKSDEAKAAREDKGWAPYSYKDPDTGEVISARMNMATGKVEPIEQGGRNVGDIKKPGTKFQGVDAKNLADIRETTQSALDELNQLLTPEGNKLAPHAAAASGWSNLFGIPAKVPDIGGTGINRAMEGEAGINSLKSKLMLDVIGKLKAQSKTGATGFGAMNLKELGVLENSATKLKSGLDDEANLAELQRVKKHLENILSESDEEKAAARGSGDQTTGKGKSRRSADQILQQHGYK